MTEESLEDQLKNLAEETPTETDYKAKSEKVTQRKEVYQELVRIVTKPIVRTGSTIARGSWDYIKSQTVTMVGLNAAVYALPTAARIFVERGDNPEPTRMQTAGAYTGGFFGVCGLVGQACLYSESPKALLIPLATNLYSVCYELVKKAARNVEQRRQQRERREG